MSEIDEVRVVVLEGRAYETRADGSLMPIVGRTDWRRVDKMSDAEIEAAAAADPDARPMSDDEWARAPVAKPTKIAVGLKLDDDVLGWFKAQGRGYQTRINAVLRRYVEAQRRAG